MQIFRVDERSPYCQLVGVGGLGTGIFFELQGNATLGRSESRLGRLLDVRDYCKLHIVIHYIARLLGAQVSGAPFHVIPVGKVGADAAGRRVIEEMRQVGIDTGSIEVMPSAPTLFSVCFQYPDGNGGNITTNNSAAAALSQDDVERLAAPLLQSGKQRTVALAVPEVGLEVRQRFLEIASGAGAFRAASFAAGEVKAAHAAGMFELLDLVALNEGEAGELLGMEFNPGSWQGFIAGCQQLLRNSFPKLKLVVSAGSSGAYGITADHYNFCAAPEVKVASTAGAGDSLLGGIIAALSAGIPFVVDAAKQSTKQVQSAVELGVLLGSYKCLSPHTIHPEASLAALVDFAHSCGRSFSPEVRRCFAEAFTAPVTS